MCGSGGDNRVTIAFSKYRGTLKFDLVSSICQRRADFRHLEFVSSSLIAL